MEKKLFYIRDYYNLHTNQEESEINDLLNQNKTLIKQIESSLKFIIDNLYLLIIDNQRVVEFNSAPHTENEVNELISLVLSGNKIYDLVNDYNIKSNLFSITFKKLFERIFKKDGYNGEKYIVQSYVQHWLERNLAILITNDIRFEPIEKQLDLLEYTELLHGFYNQFKISLPQNWIDNQRHAWVNVDVSPNYVIDSVRTFDKDYFNGYLIKINTLDGMSPWKYTEESTRFSDHAMLNESYAFRSSVLFEKNLTTWLEFWINLKLPILQDLPFHYIQYPADILNISKELVKNKNKLEQKGNYLFFILLKNLFESSIKISNTLSFYNNDERLSALTASQINTALIELGKNAYNDWQIEKENIYKEIILTVSEVVPNEEIEEWVFSYMPKSTQNEYTKIYNTEISSLVSSYEEVQNNISIDKLIDRSNINFNLQKFNFVINKLNSSNVSEHQTKLLLNHLSDYLITENFYWDRSFSPVFWATLKGIGKLLSLRPKSVLSAQ